jgi:cytochrome c-type biogenesis protein CcmH/NrfG
MKKTIFLGLLLVILACTQRKVDQKQLVLNAISLQDAGKYQEAIVSFQTILDNNPEIATRYLCVSSIADLHGRLGNYPEQITWANRAI